MDRKGLDRANDEFHTMVRSTCDSWKKKKWIPMIVLNCHGEKRGEVSFIRASLALSPSRILFVAVRLSSFDDVPFPFGRKLRHFDRRQHRSSLVVEETFFLSCASSPPSSADFAPFDDFPFLRGRKLRHLIGSNNASSPAVKVPISRSHASPASSVVVRLPSSDDFPFLSDRSYDILIGPTTGARLAVREEKRALLSPCRSARLVYPAPPSLPRQTRLQPLHRRKCVAVLVTKRVIQKFLFRRSRRTGRPPIRALLQRGGMGNRCDAYDEKGIFISTRLRGNDCASFRQPAAENDDDDIIKELLIDSYTSPESATFRNSAGKGLISSRACLPLPFHVLSSPEHISRPLCHPSLFKECGFNIACTYG
ncbi:hypothetical protein M5K25_001745 [Dendrobium thyrsiflorum]|uniref:Uncharacterized protein n=1 Tax=Dendrobium thyrsiflorum TaxID=117978 RepID=A0ABD0VS85_DENTH